MIDITWNDKNGTPHSATVPKDEVDDLVDSIKASGGRVTSRKEAK